MSTVATPPTLTSLLQSRHEVAYGRTIPRDRRSSSAGGIGITPFRSMLVQAAHQKLPHRLFLAGPPQMVKDLHAMLAKQSVSDRDIHAEEFSGY